MKLSSIMATGAALQPTMTAVAVSQSTSLLSSFGNLTDLDHHHFDAAIDADMWKRRGGGGSHGRGGSTSSSKSGSSSGSSGGRGASSSSPSSSSGGRTTTGSGVAPAYGGGRFYGGGTTVPYRAGSRSSGGIVPFVLVSVAFWPGVWQHAPYLYPYDYPWNYHNQTSDRDEVKPAICGCEPYQVCGCDDNNDQAYILSIIGNGSYSSLNRSVVCIGDVDGTETILINGTLPNGTTASGGSQPPNTSGGPRHLNGVAGWWQALATAAFVALFA
ncbi:hypothetical protein J7T55_005403, partial [Diaporthe amygdali]|uniref:uncharacterized protein n=1 Tax=Phomopsis amygdali TaxID=1214568 RepID=UPI0022FDDC49